MWLDEGTEFARLSAVNCGAYATILSDAELKAADDRLKENIKKLLVRAGKKTT